MTRTAGAGTGVAVGAGASVRVGVGVTVGMGVGTGTSVGVGVGVAVGMGVGTGTSVGVGVGVTVGMGVGTGVGVTVSVDAGVTTQATDMMERPMRASPRTPRRVSLCLRMGRRCFQCIQRFLIIRESNTFLRLRKEIRMGVFVMFQSLCDSLHNRISLHKHCVVPEAKHLENKGSQVIIATCVIWRLLSVLATVYFDNKAFLQADEVNNVRTNRSLATEFEAVDLVHSEVGPQLSFCVCRVVLE